MKFRIRDEHGQEIIIDNEGQVNGQVKITGESPLVPVLDFNLNHQLDIQTHESMEVIRSQVGTDNVILEKGKPPKIYKASDSYLKGYFIPYVCPAMGFEAKIIEE